MVSLFGCIREVEPVKTCYFVESLVWPEEELMAKVARLHDAEDRSEEVAKASRQRWAGDILVQE